MPEHDDERVAHAPWQTTVREVDLRPVPRHGLEAHGWRWGRPEPRDKHPKPRDSAGVVSGAALGEEPRPTQVGIFREPVLHERREGREIRNDPGPRSLTRLDDRQQLLLEPLFEPAVHRVHFPTPAHRAASRQSPPASASSRDKCIRVDAPFMSRLSVVESPKVDKRAPAARRGRR